MEAVNHAQKGKLFELIERHYGGQLKGKKKVDSTQTDAETGNTQSVKADGGGNIAQSQSGRSNNQSINIGPGVSGTPSVTQTQTGANKKQSIVVDGKKVEKTQN